MKLTDFKIEDTFYTGSGKWYVLDIGTRSIIAIKASLVSELNLSNIYNWDELIDYGIIFTEVDFGGCRLKDTFNGD